VKPIAFIKTNQTMKIKTVFTSTFNLRFLRTGTKRFRFNSFLSPLLVAGVALLFGPAGSFRAAAGTFPVSAQAEQSPSFACFRIVVDPLFSYLVSDPDGSGPMIAYPGWNGSTLTSPGLSDPSTIIGESKGFNAPPLPTDYPVDIGGSLPPSLGDYQMPSPFAGLYPDNTWPYPVGGPFRTMLTELQKLTLSGGPTNCANTPLLPVGIGQIEVKAGFWNSLRRSVGMVQSQFLGFDYDTLHPARSFFDVFVEVKLPLVPNSESASAFPSTGAVLYNDVPLYVRNETVTELPPIVGYYHDPATMAVPLKFKYTSPYINPATGDYYYHAGQVFGNLELAGHGLFDPCAKNAAVDAFIVQILGTIGHSALVAPIGGMYPGTSYPWANSTYGMAKGTNFGVGQPIDTITFTSATSLSARYLTAFNFLNPLPSLPSFGNSATYINNNTSVTVEWAYDGVNYFPGSASGTVQIMIANNNAPYNGTTTYDTELQTMDLTGTTFFGQFMLRKSPTKAALGKHIVESGGPGFRIGGYFDVPVELSLNGGVSWTAADYPVRLRLGNPPCGANLEQIYARKSGANTIITWLNPSYTLEGSASLSPAVWIPIASTSPVTLPSVGPYKFFRLTCQ
jgi:hypothetical protein